MTKLVTIDTYTDPWLAHIAKGRLEAEGIPVFIAHENHIWVDWVISQALGGVKLQVAENKVAQAKTVLNSLSLGEYEVDADNNVSSEKLNVCPNCGSNRIKDHYSIATLLLLVFTLGISGIIFPPQKKNHECHQCHYKWTDT